MNWSNNPRRAAQIALGVCFLAFLVSPAPFVQAKPKTTEEKENAIPIPPGHDAKGVKIPFYQDGRLQMLFNMETAFRLDMGHLRMANLKIETYDEMGKPDMGIDMPVSLLDIGANVISSADPVTIHRSDFLMTGTHMTFNTQTRQGKFCGPAKMVIFNSDGFEGAAQKGNSSLQASGGTAR